MSVEIVSTVLAAAASYDLTDLVTAKDELEIDPSDEAEDAWLGRAITQISRAAMKETNRVFAPEFVQDQFDVGRTRMQVPTGAHELQLSRWPVLSVASVVLNVGFGVTQTLALGVDYRLDAAAGQLFRLDANTGRIISWEPIPVSVKYTAGYGAAVSETHPVPASPYKVTVSQAAAFSCDQSVTYANGTALTAVAANPAQGQYSVAAGVYTFNAADLGQNLTFAYAVLGIPADLVEACLRLITNRYKAKDRDPALVQRDTPGVGTERFWFGMAPGQDGPFPPDIAALLDNYRAPTLG